MKQHDETKVSIDDLLKEAENYEYRGPAAHNKIHFTEKELKYIEMMLNKGAPRAHIAEQLTKMGKRCGENVIIRVGKEHGWI